jgi:hypothetical protein
LWRKFCRSCFAANKREEQQEMEGELTHYKALCARLQQERTIPDDKLKRLIQLCHPDKHGNSKVSTEVTQWLLDLRKRGG